MFILVFLVELIFCVLILVLRFHVFSYIVTTANMDPWYRFTFCNFLLFDLLYLTFSLVLKTVAKCIAQVLNRYYWDREEI